VKMFSKFRHRVGMRFPKLRKVWSLVWGAGYHFMWLLRKFATGNRPIEVRVGNESIYMVPEGHIAKLMWNDWFEKNERDFVANHIKPGMCVINIGANTGLYTLIAAKLVGQKGVVHAFEPSTLNFSRLTRNVTLNEFDNICLNQMAVSDFTGTLAVMRDPAHPELDSHYFVQRVEDGRPPADAVELIPCDTIDNYWRRACQDDMQIDLIIMDVEGAELSVFKGMLALIGASPGLVLMVECTENLDEIDTLLRTQGFSFYLWNVMANCFEKTAMKRGTIYAMRNN
jgi:FkbM family methyltransferase